MIRLQCVFPEPMPCASSSTIKSNSMADLGDCCARISNPLDVCSYLVTLHRYPVHCSNSTFRDTDSLDHIHSWRGHQEFFLAGPIKCLCIHMVSVPSWRISTTRKLQLSFFFKKKNSRMWYIKQTAYRCTMLLMGRPCNVGWFIFMCSTRAMQEVRNRIPAKRHQEPYTLLTATS